MPQSYHSTPALVKRDENMQRPHIYDVPFFERNAQLLEHILLLGCIKSYRLYTQMKERLCPRLPDKRNFRPDFTRMDYNKVHNIAARFWESIAGALKDREMAIAPDLMDVMLSKEVERGTMTVDEVRPIVEWLIEDIRSVELDPGLLQSLPDSPMFLQWIEQRALEYEHRRLQHSVLGRPPTLVDYQESVRAVQKTIAPPGKMIVNPVDVFTSTMRFRAPVRTLTLPDLDDKVGGGFKHGDTAVSAAISAGGKTVIAMQLAREFAVQGHNTVVVTTEQPPWQLLMRAISAHLELDFGLFGKRIRTAAETSRIADVELPFVPDECYASPENTHKIVELRQKLDTHLRFVDWSGGGMSLVNNFDAAIEQITLQYPGWQPEVIIVDWVGGGLDQKSYRGDQLRHFYKQAGETIITHGKRHQRIMFMMAQLNKAMVRPTTSYVSMDMLAECKSLVDNAASFIALTARRNASEYDSPTRLQEYQSLCVDKARWGVGGSLKVRLAFHFQKITLPARTILRHA